MRTAQDVKLEKRLPLPGLELVDVPQGDSVVEAVRRLAGQPEVRYAEPNYISQPQATVPNEPYFSVQWGLDNTGQYPFYGTPDADIDAPEAWDFTRGSSAVTVAIADTGVIFSQPDLAPNLRSTGFDFVGSGDPDPTDPMTGPTAGHGTYVAGIVGAVGNNAYGTAGVNWNVGLEPIRVCDGTGCTDGDLIEGMIYAGNQSVRIFNASLGGTPFNQAVKDAIDAAPNTLFVFSAGNNGLSVDSTPSYPCAYASPNVICVAATDANDQLWSSSNYGATTVDLAAPGVDVASTNPDYNFNPILAASGTSASAPAVSGAAALLLAVTPGMSPAQLKSAIFAGVDPRPSLNGKTVTGGRLNIDHLVPNPPPVPPVSPPQPTTSPTGQRAGALKKCKKKKGRARRNCKRKANQLPV